MTDFKWYCKHCKKLLACENCPKCDNKGNEITGHTHCTELINSNGDLCNETLKITLNDSEQIIFHKDCPKTHYKQHEQKPNKPTGDNKKGMSGGAIALIVIGIVLLVGLAGLYFYRQWKKEKDAEDNEL